ncbi:MAG: fatty acid desaturase [Verrucomicrobia bacterium]|nr:fatty acid desaturase [Verrucomicrobiota bacterium]
MVAKSSQLLAVDSLRRWTRLQPYSNLAAVGFEYACLLVVHAATILFLLQRDDWGLPIWMTVPVGLVTFVFTGVVLHRIGLLGHESSHHLLLPNRFWNDVIANLTCFFPLWSSLTSYRAKHSGHHLHPNDPEHDPNWAGDKAADLYARFPMPRPSFILQYYVKFFWPPFVLRNLVDLTKVLSVGSGPKSGPRRPWFKSPTLCGLLSLLLMIGVTRVSEINLVGAWVLLPPAAFLLTVLGIMALIPASFYEGAAAGGLAYSRKWGALYRLSFHGIVFLLLCGLQILTGLPITLYYALFWILPLVYVFPYLMLLREVYQHANLGVGKLDNSRIIHADPFTRWAVLGYGNDFHLVHHIYPNIPHYNLRGAHDELMKTSESYRAQFEETVGTFRAPSGKRSLLDSLTGRPRQAAGW